MVFQGFKKVQKSRFKNGHEPADTTRKPTLRVFFSDPEKPMCQSTHRQQHVSTPLLILSPAKSNYFLNGEQTEVTDF